jgi:hypothetical protein
MSAATIVKFQFEFVADPDTNVPGWEKYVPAFFL